MNNKISGSDISLAQWSLVEEIRAGQWKTLDFPGITRKDFGLNGIELVNTLMEVPTIEYLKILKKNAGDHGIEVVLIMVDDEGDGCSAERKDRRQFEINHRKWVDAAHFLGCHAIRTNCRGPENPSPGDSLEWAAETYQWLLEYATPASISILIENHGGLSNDPDWMLELMHKVNHPGFGIYPDWREPTILFNNVEYLQKTLPFARGMSYRNQATENLTAEMIRMCIRGGYRGWYGIESSGREAIHTGKKLLKKYLPATG